MKAGKTISELAAEVTNHRALARDYRLPQSALQMGNDGVMIAGRLTIKPNRLMHAQLAERLGVPTKYYDRMRADAPELLARNVNEWLGRDDAKRFVRTYAPSQDTHTGSKETPLVGRAFLGSTYRPLDNYDLITALVPSLSAAGVEIVSSEVTESRLYIQAVAQNFKSKVVVPGTHDRINDVLNIGLIASNSEVGGGSLSIRALLYRQVCTNGLVLDEDLPGFKQIHIGRGGDDGSEAYLSDESKRLRDAAIWSKARDVIKAAISQATLDKVTARINRAAGAILQHPEAALDLIAEKYDLVEDERAAVMRNLIAGGDVSQWGLVNAVTALANTTDSYDRAVDLEVIGGKVLSLASETFGRN